MDALKDNDWRGLDGLGHRSPLVQGEVVSGNLAVAPADQLDQLFVGQVEVERLWVVEVVICRVVVLVVPARSRGQSLAKLT